MVDYTASVVSVGVDWITVSAEEGPKAKLLTEYGLHAVGSEAGKRDRMYECRAHGLTGWRTRHAVCMWSAQRTVVELHEHLSHEQWADAMELADNCSRIDVEVTVRQEPFDRKLAIREWETSLAARAEVGKDPYYDLYARKGQGNTLYIGSGASRFKARLYDKGCQSREPVYRDCWRYEVQARRERASQLVERLGAAADPSKDVAGLVYGHFAARGVVPIYEQTDPTALPPLPRSPTDAERSLAWVEATWRPTVRRLVDWGVDQEAWKALDFRFDPRTGKKL